MAHGHWLCAVNIRLRMCVVMFSWLVALAVIANYYNIMLFVVFDLIDTVLFMRWWPEVNRVRMRSSHQMFSWQIGQVELSSPHRLNPWFNSLGWKEGFHPMQVFKVFWRNLSNWNFFGGFPSTSHRLLTCCNSFSCWLGLVMEHRRKTLKEL